MTIDTQAVRATTLPTDVVILPGDEVIILSSGILYRALVSDIASSMDMRAIIRVAPTLADEAAATSAGLAAYTFYKTPTGELRYKLPSGRIFTHEFTPKFT